MINEIVITGIGVESAYGAGAEAYWSGLQSMENCSYTQEFGRIQIDSGSVIGAKRVKEIEDPEERILMLGTEAIKQCVNDWGGSLNGYNRITFILGSGLGLTDSVFLGKDIKIQQKYLAELPKKLMEQADIEGNMVYISNSCCAGSQAISYGMDLLMMQETDLVIAGGLDILSETAFGGFMRLNSIDFNGCRPFDQNRKGIMVGEGACFYILERKNPNQNKIYGVLKGSYITNDAFHIVQMEPQGREISRCILGAIEDSDLIPSDIQLVIAHGTGTILNDKIESEVICRIFGDNVLVTSPKGAIGHTGGASGAFGLLTAIGAVINNIIPPTKNLIQLDEMCRIQAVYNQPAEKKIHTAIVNAFAFGGTNVVIVFQRYAGEINEQ